MDREINDKHIQNSSTSDGVSTDMGFKTFTFLMDGRIYNVNTGNYNTSKSSFTYLTKDMMKKEVLK